MQFFVNKFPIHGVYSTDNNQMEDIPEGSIFRVVGINGSMFEMMPVRKTECQSILISVKMLAAGFTKTEFIEGE